jgi:hypothetical protein
VNACKARRKFEREKRGDIYCVEEIELRARRCPVKKNVNIRVETLTYLAQRLESWGVDAVWQRGLLKILASRTIRKGLA